MKKIYFGCILFLTAACAKQDIAIKESLAKLSAVENETILSFDEAIKLMSENSNTANSPNNAVMLAATTVEEEVTNINLNDYAEGSICQPISNGSNEIIPTNGFPLIYNEGNESRISIRTAYDQSNNTNFGSGFAIRFPFKKGATYTITFLAEFWAYQVVGDVVNSVKRPPILMAKLTNTLNVNSPCTQTLPISFSEPDPVHTYSMPFTSDYALKTLSVQFTPDQCYEYIWFSAKPNTAGKSLGKVVIRSLFQFKKKNEINIIGPNVLNANEQATYTVEYNTFPIGSNFTWSVTGDLEIVGSNVGSAAVIKSNGLGGGDIKISLNGCNDLIVKKLGIILSEENIKIAGPLQINIPTSQASTFSIQLYGPLVDYEILSVSWDFPPSWNNTNLVGTPRSIFLPETAETGYVHAVVEVEGAVAPITLSKFVKVRMSYH